MIRRTLQIAGILLLVGTVYAQEYVVEVTRVYSGDTVAVRRNERVGRLKIRGVTCPDPETATGEKALRFLEAAVLDKWVKVRELGKDDADVNLGRVFIGEREVALDLLRAGLAEYDRSTLSSMEFSEAQELARAAGIGVWAAPVEPPKSVAAKVESEAPAADEPAPEEVRSDPDPPADQTFEKVDFVEHKGEDRKELDAKITFSGDALIIASDKGDREFVRIPYESIDEASYEQSTHTR
ncbi:MAG: thermonuclease family protein, partial [Acidobacteriota bacterium]